MDTIRVDILDALDNVIGDGPLTGVISVKVVSALDGAGSFSLTLPGTEERALDLATNKRQVRIYRSDELGNITYVGGGTIRTVAIQTSGHGWSLKIDGPDEFDSLRRRSMLLRREYREMPLLDVIENIVDTLTDWTVTVEPVPGLDIITVRFDGESVLKGLQLMAESYGYHLRRGVALNALEFGAFGNVLPLTLVKPRVVTHAMNDNPNIAIVTSIAVKRDTSDLVNRIYPVGGGEGLGALTLQYATFGSPYTINNVVGPDGNVMYYLEDVTSIAEYGLSEKVGLFKEITPIDNTDAGILIAANALYLAASAYLERQSQRLDTYRLSVTKLDQTIRPGDKVRLLYRGMVYDDKDLPVDVLSIDDDLWVMKITQTIDRGGIKTDLEVSTVDRKEMDAAKIIVGSIEQIELRNLRVQPYPTTATFVYKREIDATHTAIVPIDITNGTLYLDRCRIRLTSRPFRATAMGALSGGGAIVSSAAGGGAVLSSASGGAAVVSSAAGGAAVLSSASGGSSTPSSAAGGNHNHKVFASIPAAGFPATFPFEYTGRTGSGGPLIWAKLNTSSPNDLWTDGASGDHTHTVTIPAHTHGVTIPDHTHNVSIPAHTHGVTIPDHTHGVTVPAHTHGINYGITDDVLYPNTVSVWINGVDRTVALGGPWGVGGVAIDQVLEIEEYLNTAPGGIRNDHTVDFRCVSGQGEIEVSVELKITVQSVQQV